MGRGRGFTLLELMIVIALVIALAALAWPGLASLSPSVVRREAESRLGSAAMAARAESEIRGEVLEVWVVGDAPARIELRRVGTAPMGRDSERESANVEGAGATVLRMGELPSGVVIAGGAAGGGGFGGTEERGSGEMGLGGMMLLTAWPDGRSELAGAWGFGIGDEVWRGVLNEWTGGLRFEVVEEGVALEEEADAAATGGGEP